MATNHVFHKGQKVMIVRANRHNSYTGPATITSNGSRSSEMPGTMHYDVEFPSQDFRIRISYDKYMEPILDVTLEFSKKAL